MPRTPQCLPQIVAPSSIFERWPSVICSTMGCRDDRMIYFDYTHHANVWLDPRVRKWDDAAEYACLRQRRDTLSRPTSRDLKWSAKQMRALSKIREGISYDEEEEKRNRCRWQYIGGVPGSGKSAVILEAAVRAATHRHRVLIGCPTGQRKSVIEVR